jgi:hypothetical protein
MPEAAGPRANGQQRGASAAVREWCRGVERRPYLRCRSKAFRQTAPGKAGPSKLGDARRCECNLKPRDRERCGPTRRRLRGCASRRTTVVFESAKPSSHLRNRSRNWLRHHKADSLDLCSGGGTQRCWTSWPNVRAELPAEAGGAWPRKENRHLPLERPSDACRSGSARARG